MRRGRSRHIATGEELRDEIFTRNYDLGSHQVIFYGSKGSGKTTLLMQIALKSIQVGDLVVWRGRFRDIWPRLEPEQLVLFFHHQDKPLIKRSPIRSSKIEIVNDLYNIKYYKDPKDLIRKLQENVINVVYEPSYIQFPEDFAAETGIDHDIFPGVYWWFWFLHTLNSRDDSKWYTICFDEVHDLSPSGISGKAWKIIEWGVSTLSEMRDRYVSFYGTTHSLKLLDYRFVQKFSFFGYLAGAKVHKESAMKHKGVINWLDPGEVILDRIDKGVYGKILFDPLPSKKFVYLIERSWTGPKPSPKKEEKRGTLKEEIIEIAKKEGVERALEVLREMYKQKKISQAHYYRLKGEVGEVL